MAESLYTELDDFGEVTLDEPSLPLLDPHELSEFFFNYAGVNDLTYYFFGAGPNSKLTRIEWHPA